ncbi:VanZ family protein [Turicibacter sanguinis]|uniref:VanZ family protein n=1 Tax=Turicibacter sanguinis TaxID=154288 RepID=UPI00189EA656|nr:VanZ family protein [Turicibacter sanguinis]
MEKVRVLFTILWMGFIFFQGTQTGDVSIESSDRIVNPIVEVIEKTIEWLKPKQESSESEPVKETVETSPKPTESQREILYKKVHYIVRKSAHFFEYAVLGGLAFWMFQGFRVSFWNQVIYSLFMILSVAVMDEYLQSFVARTSSVSDILIDFSGGMTGILILYLIKKVFG